MLSRDKWVKNELLKMPLVLFDNSMNEYSNYYYTFKTPKYINFSHYKIYNFDGIVKENNDNFVIYNDKIKSTIDNQEFSFCVIVYKNIITGHYAAKIGKLLHESSLNNYNVKCFAIGIPVKENGRVVLNIEKINRFFIKKKQIKNQETHLVNS